MSESPLADTLRQTLLQLAADSITHGLRTGQVLPVDPAQLPPELQCSRATFVTLRLNQALQGCIGTLRPIRPLSVDVARNAYSAGFDDPRGGTLTLPDLARLEIHISILSPAQPLQFTSESGVLAQLRPGIDGITIEENGRHGTLLPSVWAALPDPREFLENVKIKAGLPRDYWSQTLKVERYTTESFSRNGDGVVH